MNGILEVTNAIDARLTTVLTALALPVPTFRFGEDQLRRQDEPNRIVWVPKRGSVDRNIMPAADFPSNFTGAPAGADRANPRPLWRRKPLMEAHVWAIRANHRSDTAIEKDFAAAELLGNHLVGAVHDLLYGSYAVVSEDWGTTQASAQRMGAVLIIGFEFWFAWTRELEPTAIVTAIPITPEVTAP